MFVLVVCWLGSCPVMAWVLRVSFRPWEALSVSVGCVGTPERQFRAFYVRMV